MRNQLFFAFLKTNYDFPQKMEKNTNVNCLANILNDNECLKGLKGSIKRFGFYKLGNYSYCDTIAPKAA